MIRESVDWLDDRLGMASWLRHALRKAFPDHWSFLLGEIAMYSFVFLLASGIFLAFFFHPSAQKTIYEGPYAPLHGITMSGAYESVLALSFDTRLGLLVRQMHHWAALIFIAAIVVHMGRVFFTGAFRRPREITWLVGVTLLLLALGAGFTGYSLPDDLLSGTGLRIAYSVALSIPFIGAYLAFVVFGGVVPTLEMAGRLFFMHVFLLPALIAGGLGLHLALVWRQKHTQFASALATERTVAGSPMWPNYAMKSTGLMLATFAVIAGMGAFFQINPIWLYGPYDPAKVSSPAQPDWYFGWLEGALRIGPAWELHAFGHSIPPPFFVAVLLPAVLITIVYAWPFIEATARRDRSVHHLLEHPSDNPLRTAIGAALYTIVIVLTFAGSDDVQARVLTISTQSLVLFYRGALPLAPIIVGFITFELAREVRARRLHPKNERVILVRDDAGGFVERPEVKH